MVKMKILKDVVLACRDRTLTTAQFAALARARKEQVWYLVSLANNQDVPKRYRQAALAKAQAINADDLTLRMAKAHMAREDGDLMEALLGFRSVLTELKGLKAARVQRIVDALERVLIEPDPT